MVNFRPYRRRADSNLTPGQRGFAWGFGFAAIFWTVVGALIWYFG